MPKKKAARKPKKSAVPKSRHKSSSKVSTKKKAGSRRTSKAANAQPAESLGRPQITGDEKLYLLFREDYHARQVFEFLRVETVRELEAYSAQQIIKLLSQPIQRTVNRIRDQLAQRNRHLLDDKEYALEHKRGHASPRGPQANP